MYFFPRRARESRKIRISLEAGILWSGFAANNESFLFSILRIARYFYYTDKWCSKAYRRGTPIRDRRIHYRYEYIYIWTLIPSNMPIYERIELFSGKYDTLASLLICSKSRIGETEIEKCQESVPFMRRRIEGWCFIRGSSLLLNVVWSEQVNKIDIFCLIPFTSIFF